MKKSDPRPPIHIHVDMDELWAIASCYGLRPFSPEITPVYSDGAPRLAALFDDLGLRVTWFVVGSDVLHGDTTAARFLRDRLQQGDQVGNHSMTHRLQFRSFSRDQIRQEIQESHRAIEQATGTSPQGFRAPGYGHSQTLITELIQAGYAYDSSLCPSPFGGVFRWMDSRISQEVHQQGWGPQNDGSTDSPSRNLQTVSLSATKTQYSQWQDLRYPLAPHWQDGLQPRASQPHRGILEFPTAVAPGFRLPYQAGICARLGPLYTWGQTRAWRWLAPRVPLTLLLHGADLTDFSSTGHPFFLRSPFFAMPMDTRFQRVRSLLQQALHGRRNLLTEDTLEKG